jgi:hypothetical protein
MKQCFHNETYAHQLVWSLLWVLGKRLLDTSCVVPTSEGGKREWRNSFDTPHEHNNHATTYSDKRERRLTITHERLWGSLAGVAAHQSTRLEGIRQVCKELRPHHAIVNQQPP